MATVKKPSALPVSFDQFKKNKKIRVGFFSSDFYDHATMHLLGDMLQCLDKSEFEYIYFEVSFEDTSFFDLLKTKYLRQGIQPLIVVAKMYPPNSGKYNG